MEALFNHLMAWIHHHPTWAGVVVCLVALSESVAVIGLFVPGSVVMPAIGALIGSGVLPAGSTLVWAITGAVVGDGASYLLGYKYNTSIRNVSLMRRYSGMFERGEKFLLKHGGKSVFLGRFLGPLRPIMPLLAGMMNMVPRRFFTASIFSAFLWAPAYLLPGVLLGAISLDLSPRTAGRFIIALAVLLLSLWLLSWVFRLTYHTVWRLWQNFLVYQWKALQQSHLPDNVKQLLDDPHGISISGHLNTLYFTLLMGLLFLGLTASVMQVGFWASFNEPIHYIFQNSRSHTGDVVTTAIAMVGDKPVVLITLLLCFTYLALQRAWRAAWHWIIGGGLTGALGLVLKHVIHSPRPSDLVLMRPSFSYPSGHILMMVFTLSFITVLCSPFLSPLMRRCQKTLVVLLLLCLAISRLYVGVHWPTDLIGALLLGLTFLGGTTLSYRSQLPEKFNGRRLLALFYVSLLVGGTLWGHYRFNKYMHDYQPVVKQVEIDGSQWWLQGAEHIPIHRNNRLGRRMEAMNVQWAGELASITKSLRVTGWHQRPRFGFDSLWDWVIAKHGPQGLPLFPPLFHQRLPKLVMVHCAQGESQDCAVLRLWMTSAVLPPALPLWFGTVYQVKVHPFFHMKRQRLLFPPAATEILLQDLKGWRTRELVYTQHDIQRWGLDPDWDGKVLLLKPNA